MNIALIGYGRMGHRIEALSPDHEADVQLILDIHNNKNGSGITEESMASIDAVIDFSHPDVFKTNFEKVLQTGTPVVIGTTGWLDNREAINELCTQHKTPALYGSNFSLGVQLFAKLVQQAGEIFGDGDFFDTTLNEVHHTQKADAPSGTAYTLADLWLKGASSDKKVQYGIPEKGQVDDDKFYVTSQRLGSVFGEHQLRINSEFDDIVLTHRARSRDAFAAGALKAAHWLLKQEPGFYLIEDVVEEVVKL